MQCAHKFRISQQSPLKQYHYAFSQYQLRAANRDIPFLLTEEQALELFTSPCHYCGAEPSSKIARAKGIDKKYLYYQGIDRIDSSKGYEAANVLPCCKKCNTAKLDMSYDDFMELISKIYLRNVQRLDRKIVEPSGSKWGTPLPTVGEDIVWSAWQHAAG